MTEGAERRFPVRLRTLPGTYSVCSQYFPLGSSLIISTTNFNAPNDPRYANPSGHPVQELRHITYKTLSALRSFEILVLARSRGASGQEDWWTSYRFCAQRKKTSILFGSSSRIRFGYVMGTPVFLKRLWIASRRDLRTVVKTEAKFRFEVRHRNAVLLHGAHKYHSH